MRWQPRKDLEEKEEIISDMKTKAGEPRERVNMTDNTFREIENEMKTVIKKN